MTKSCLFLCLQLNHCNCGFSLTTAQVQALGEKEVPVMRDCFAVRSSRSASSPVLNSHSHPPPPPRDGDSAISSSSHPSPALDIYSRYNRVIRSNPYSGSWRIALPSNSVPVHGLLSPARLDDEAEHQLTLADLLHPNREAVNEALLLAKDSNLNPSISNFFQHSEDTTYLLLDLYNSVNLARKRYRPVLAVLNDLPHDSLSQSQIDQAFDEFAIFHAYSNPFPAPDANNLDEMRQCFSQLKNYLNRRTRKSNSKIRLISLALTHSALCSGRFCTACIQRKAAKKDPARQKAAADELYVLGHELISLVYLAKRVHNSVEVVRDSIRLGLERGRDRHSIEDVLNQLRSEQTTFLKQLDSLNEHICYCHGIVSSIRDLLFDEVSSSITS